MPLTEQAAGGKVRQECTEHSTDAAVGCERMWDVRGCGMLSTTAVAVPGPGSSPSRTAPSMRGNQPFSDIYP